MRQLYSALFYLLLPLVFLRLLWRSRSDPDYRRRWGERLGFAPPSGVPPSGVPPSGEPPKGVIWLHAVSLGETLAARPLVQSLLADYPDLTVLVTTTTPTGSRQVRALFGGRVAHVYAPFDLPAALRPFLRRYRPRLLVLMETELWPNLLALCRDAGCPVLLANARLSQRSARAYARLGRFTRALLQNVDRAACQSRADARRLAVLGLPRTRVSVSGNIKFDLEIDAALRARIAARAAAWRTAERFVFVAGSTHPGEDELVLGAFRVLREALPHALLVLVPRHPARSQALVALCQAQGWTPRRLSLGQDPGPGDVVVLGDTTGELLALFGLADVAFVGGSLMPHGGHNLLEPAALGIPVLCGPHLQNFIAVRDLLKARGALRLVSDAATLGESLCELARDSALRGRMGEAGARAVAENRGAREHLLSEVRQLLRVSAR
jgi:3-deoxy-D-manno-octulosonic-acid transferase